jgi:uncharacterized cupin superfamily protein
MPVVEDPEQIPGRRGTIYPEPYKQGFEGRVKRALTEVLGLTQYGVNLTTLEPGARSALRHWHRVEDECVFIVEGEATLVTDAGERVLRRGQIASFPAGVADGHCLVNNGDRPVTFLEIGTRSKDEDVTYPDVDLAAERRNGTLTFSTKAGKPIAAEHSP